MQQIVRSYFPANECFVITGLAPVGGFVAHIEGEPLVRGHGQTRLAAIEDLSEALALVGSIYERDEELIQAAE